MRSTPAAPVDIDGSGTVIERRRPVERQGPVDLDGRRPNLRHDIDIKEPNDSGETLPPARRGQGPGDRGYRPRDRYDHGGYHHDHHYGCGHYGFGYDPFFFGFGFHSPIRSVAYYRNGFGGYYYAPEIHVSVGGGGGGGEREVAMGALDLDLRPDKAEIFVDGYFVGVADQFDGFPSYLWLEEGTYEIAFYKEGYETIFRQYTIYPGVIIDIDDRMRPGESILPTGPLPEPPAGTSSMPIPGLSGDLGRIAVVATPADAAIYLDGHFVGTAAEISALAAGLIVEPGDHVIEVIRPGFSTESIPVSVPAGEQTEVQLDLTQR